MEIINLFNKEKDLLLLYSSALCTDPGKKFEDLIRCSLETEFISLNVFVKTFRTDLNFGGKLTKGDMQKFLINHSYME